MRLQPIRLPFPTALQFKLRPLYIKKKKKKNPLRFLHPQLGFRIWRGVENTHSCIETPAQPGPSSSQARGGPVLYKVPALSPVVWPCASRGSAPAIFGLQLLTVSKEPASPSAAVQHAGWGGASFTEKLGLLTTAPGPQSTLPPPPHCPRPPVGYCGAAVPGLGWNPVPSQALGRRHLWS